MIDMDAADLTDLLAEHASRHGVPGSAIGLLRAGSRTIAGCGTADVTTAEPVTPETCFSTGSLTKSMVATVIVRLTHAGMLSLDDPVAAHVPEVGAASWAARATVRDLMANRSGLPLSNGLEFGFEAHRSDDDGALSRLVADAAIDGPTAPFWSYSNIGWCLLGRVIETVTGMSWEAAMGQYLTRVAGMKRTSFGVDPGLEPRARGHQLTTGGPRPVPPLRSRAYGPAGANAVTTVSDLLTFAAMHLGDTSFSIMRTPQANVSIPGWLDAWCLGWASYDWPGGRVWGWDGLVNGERCVLRLLPDQHAAIALMTNCGSGRALYRSLFADLVPSVLGVHVPPVRYDTSPSAAGDLARYQGTYAWPDRRIEVTATAFGLRLAMDDGETDALPIDERTFLVDAEDPDTPTITFSSFDPAGQPQVLYEMIWGLPRVLDQ